MKRWLVLAALAGAGVTGVELPRAIAAVEDDLRDGDKYFDEGSWQRAAAAYDRAIAKAPRQVPAEAWGKRAAIYIIVKDLEGGLDFIARARQRSPGLATAPELLEQEALMLWELDREADAIALAERVVEVRPASFTNQKLIGEYYASRDVSRTVVAFEAYLAHRPANLEPGDVLPRVRLGFARLALGRIALTAGNAEHARVHYSKAAEQFEHVQRRLAKRPNAQVNADNGLCAAYTGLGRYDQAVTACERVVADPAKIDASGAAWFNLATSYLARKQTRKARASALEFAKLRKTEARGHKLVGDTFFAERAWATALDHYLQAEKLARGPEHVQLSIQLGKTYRRMPSPANLGFAIDKLEAALRAHPASGELAAELGGAYLEAKLDTKASELTERLLAGTLEVETPELRARVLVVSAKALFNLRKLEVARQRFEAAQALRPADVTIRRALVVTINEQAHAARQDPRAAQALLEQALALDPASAITLTNLAVLEIARGECASAQRRLQALADVRGRDEVVRTRLVARSQLCLPAPDLAQAQASFAIAEREARKANATLALAAVYAEWAPLTWDADLPGAIGKLELAVQTAGADPAIASTAKRNLALAVARRGWKHLRDGKPAEAAADFERAARDASVLEGAEPQALELARALALFDAGRGADGARLLKGLASKGHHAAYLRPPFAKAGGALLAAYASYHAGSVRERQQAAAELARLAGEGLGPKLDELIASTWELVAYEQWRAGQHRAAAKSLATASQHATGDAKRRIAMDRAALSLDRTALRALEAMGSTPPEALVNLGILYDLAGKPKEAHDAWVKAKARGAQGRDLARWIDAKKRIYGY